MKNVAIHHSITSDVEEVDRVCKDAWKLLECQGLIVHAFEGELLLREFLNNAIIHGHRCDRRKRVKVTVQVGRKWIILRIADTGPGFAWRSTNRVPPDGADTSGRGLAIGAQYAQRMRFNRAGNQVTLWIKKNRRKGDMEMTDFEIIRDDRQARVMLRQKLTVVEAQALQPALKQEIAAGVRKFVFDLSGTVSLDSTGIGLLIAVNNSLTAVQGTMGLINVSPDILKLLQSMRLVDRLHATVADKEVSHG
jgi:serine/threonine-protein kinase RsbW